jgi:hypothetical protein
MAQLFQRRANSIAKALMAGGALLAAGAGAALYAAGRSDFWTRVGAPLEQPVPFSHEHHVAGLGIDCRYCHTSVETSSFAGVPPTETCMTCHSQVWKDAPVLQPVRDSFQTGRPLRWTRVNDLPGYVYFNHGIHVQKGVGCAICHGPVDRMPVTWKAQPFYMRWCLDCHREPASRLRPREEVFNMAYEPPKNQTAAGFELARQNHVSSEGLTDCAACHR